MEELKDLKRRLEEERPTGWEQLPDIALYMDQVISYLPRQQIRFDNAENMTSAMVNNYIKDGLVPRANGKKYNREHLIRLAIVARLKQVLSVKDMTELLAGAGANRGAEEQYERFRTVLRGVFEHLASRTDEDELPGAALELALAGYACKIASEYLIDRMRLSRLSPEEQAAVARHERAEKIKSAAAKAEEVGRSRKQKPEAK